MEEASDQSAVQAAEKEDLPVESPSTDVKKDSGVTENVTGQESEVTEEATVSPSPPGAPSPPPPDARAAESEVSPQAGASPPQTLMPAFMSALNLKPAGGGTGGGSERTGSIARVDLWLLYKSMLLTPIYSICMYITP